MKHPLAPYAKLFKNERAFLKAKKEFDTRGSYDAEHDFWEAQYRSLRSREPKAGFHKWTEIPSDWTYNTTPPLIRWHDDGETFLISQFNGPCLDHYFFCKGKEKAKKFLLSLKSSVIVMRAPDYKTRVDKALKIRKGS